MNENLELVKNIESGMKNLSDKQVKQQFRPFVESVARRQLRGGNQAPMEELLTRGEAGLMEAWHRYNPECGCKFVPYAVWFIRQAMEGKCSKQVKKH